MKTITIKQPWASLIVQGIKDIENRTWPTKLRGRVLVHAGIKPFGSLKSDSCFTHILTESQFDAVVCERTLSGTYLDSYNFGVIIGSVEIVDCVINHPSIWAEKSYEIASPVEGQNYNSGPIYNWVLANPIMFPEPIPAKGRLSFWDSPSILAEPEEEGGELFCHCQIPVKEHNQVMSIIDRLECRYCGGRWYK